MMEDSKNAIADLHIHCYDKSTNPKGISIKEILEQAKRNNVKYISITSHNTLDEYEELFETISQTDEYDDMHIMIGVEINSAVGKDKLRDFLVYMPLESIEGIKPWIDANTKRDLTVECQQMQLEHFKKIGKEYGFVFDDDLTVGEGQYAGSIFATNLAQHPENYKFDEMLATTDDPKFDIIKQMLKDSEICFDDILTKNVNWFFSELVRPKESPFNISEILKSLRPNIEDVIVQAHRNNGLVFTAHPFHMDREDISEYLELCKNSGVDGIESFYITQIEDFEDDRRFVEEYCINNNLLYGSGGTDFHAPNGTDYLGIGLIGDEEHLYTLYEDDIPSWARDFSITMKEFKDRKKESAKSVLSPKQATEASEQQEEFKRQVEEDLEKDKTNRDEL